MHRQSKTTMPFVISRLLLYIDPCDMCCSYKPFFSSAGNGCFICDQAEALKSVIPTTKNHRSKVLLKSLRGHRGAGGSLGIQPKPARMQDSGWPRTLSLGQGRGRPLPSSVNTLARGGGTEWSSRLLGQGCKTRHYRHHACLEPGRRRPRSARCLLAKSGLPPLPKICECGRARVQRVGFI